MEISATELPFNRSIGSLPGAVPSLLRRLPAGSLYLNHPGTVHASAQLVLAEASSGEFLLRHLGFNNRLVPIVRRLEAKLRKPAHGAITSTVTIPRETLKPFRAGVASKGHALSSIPVEVHDDSEAITLSATVKWFITRISTDPEITQDGDESNHAR